MPKQPNVFTEEHAINKHCPFYEGNCMASQCMAWRWSESKHSQEFSKKVVARAKEKKIKWFEAHDEILKEDQSPQYDYGYCGAGGSPIVSPRP